MTEGRGAVPAACGEAVPMALRWDPPAAVPGLCLERWQLSGYRTAGDIHVKQASGGTSPLPFYI